MQTPGDRPGVSVPIPGISAARRGWAFRMSPPRRRAKSQGYRHCAANILDGGAMRVKRLIPAVLVMALLLAAGSAPTPAGPLDQRIVGLGFQYTPAEVTVAQDQPMEFTNLDLAPHDVVALRSGPNGK